jgi:cytidylate kinase
MRASQFVVTLDGPAGVGKTTLAKRIAARLSVAYLDTGAMFRTVAWKLGEDAWSLPEAELARRLASLEFKLEGEAADTQLTCNGGPLDDAIRSETVAMWASRLAALPVVRDALKAAQRDIGAARSLTAEGRDMGTVVFPQARYKFFLDATPEARAQRRFQQLQAMGLPEAYASILEQIKHRDAQDRTRAIAPLKPAPDAMLVDTTDLDVDQVFARMLALLGLEDEAAAR